MKNYQFSGLGVSDVFSLFDEVMSALEPVARVPETILNGVFPPTNCLRDKDGNLIFEFAVAGYKEEEIGLELKDDSMQLVLNPVERKLPEGTRMIQRGIRSAPARLSAFVPASKFEVNKVEASLANGILRVFIPIKKDSKALSIKITSK